MQDWITTLQQRLKAEWRYAFAEHQRCRALNATQQMALGMIWPVMRLNESSPVRRQKTELWLRSTGPLLHDGITSGDAVVVAPSLHAEGLRGTVVGADLRTATIVVDHAELPDWTHKADLVVCLEFDDRTYKNYVHGLDRCAENLDHHLVQALSNGEEVPEELPEKGAFPHLEGLDPFQSSAALMALASRHLALIHGPPGTGKTHTICALISQLAADGFRPLALADSNAAVDNLTRGLIKRGLDPLRLGSRYRIAEDVAPYSLWGRISAHPQQGVLVILEKEIRKSHGRAKGKLIREAQNIRRQIKNEIVSTASIVTSTLGTISKEIVNLDALHTAVVDEATQAIEPAIWSVAPYLQRLIIVGDPKQLGPVVMQPGNQLEMSLMTRLVEKEGVEAPMLSIQRRMSKDIMDLVRPQYGVTYQSHPSVADQRINTLTGLLHDTRLVWIDTAGHEDAEERQDTVNRSIYNSTEVLLVEHVVRLLRLSGVADADIGIIAPYSAQVNRIKERVEGVEVATVNAYQGREKSVVVCSFVRSNIEGDLGFVRDARRLTVAASRARNLWIGIGDSSTLGYDTSFQSLFNVVSQKGTWQTVWDWLFESEVQ